MLRPDLGGILLGAQVDRTERVALTPKRGDLGFQRRRAGQVRGRAAQPLQQRPIVG